MPKAREGGNCVVSLQHDAECCWCTLDVMLCARTKRTWNLSLVGERQEFFVLNRNQNTSLRRIPYLGTNTNKANLLIDFFSGLYTNFCGGKFIKTNTTQARWSRELLHRDSRLKKQYSWFNIQRRFNVVAVNYKVNWWQGCVTISHSIPQIFHS